MAFAMHQAKWRGIAQNGMKVTQNFQRTTPLPQSFKRSWFLYECFQLLERITAIRNELNKTASDALDQKKQRLLIAL